MPAESKIKIEDTAISTMMIDEAVSNSPCGENVNNLARAWSLTHRTAPIACGGSSTGFHAVLPVDGCPVPHAINVTENKCIVYPSMLKLSHILRHVS